MTMMIMMEMMIMKIMVKHYAQCELIRARRHKPFQYPNQPRS